MESTDKLFTPKQAWRIKGFQSANDDASIKLGIKTSLQISYRIICVISQRGTVQEH